MAAILTNDIFKCIFLNGNIRISIQISLKFVPKGSIDNKPALVSGNGLSLNRRQAITWSNADPVYRRIYAALGGDELSQVVAIDMKIWYRHHSGYGLNQWEKTLQCNIVSH